MAIRWMEERLTRGETILVDGAMGTELQLRGVRMNEHAWSGVCVLSHGDVVRQIHEDYIRAGAEVQITNTFASSRRALTGAGYGEQTARINKLAVELAKQARDKAATRPVAIAGSISTYFGRHDPVKQPDPPVERAAYREQAELLAEAGVDLIVLEMMTDIEQTAYALEGALATGLPVWIGFSVRRSEKDGSIVVFDEVASFEDAVKAFAGSKAAALTVMHSRIENTVPALEILRKHWKGTLGAYPHSGTFKMPEWQFVDLISAEGFADEADKWVALGTQLVGGCCGIGPDHIRVLRGRLPAKAPKR